MTRSFSARWIPFFAALLASQLAWSCHLHLGSGQATLAGMDSSAAALGPALPMERMHPALQQRASTDRHTVSSFFALPARGHGPRSGGWALGSSQRSQSTQPSGSSRHFPFFPTGPPRHR